MAKLIVPEMTVDMKVLARSPDQRSFKALLNAYYPKLARAFPDKSEYESKRTYINYLKDASFPWTMLILRDAEGTILGGIQYQVVPVNGVWLRKAIWAEHIWLSDPEGRSYKNFLTLLRIARERFVASGAQVVFFEFNDRSKMTFQQLADDAKGGLPTEARELLWGRAFNNAMHLVIDSHGRVGPYNQPGMDGEAPVEYLSLLFASLTDKQLNRILLSDYLALLQAAHSTIPSVDLEKDPTVVEYRRQLADRIAAGELYFDFVPLAHTQVTRLVETRFARTRSSFEGALGALKGMSALELITLLRGLTSACPEIEELARKAAA